MKRNCDLLKRYIALKKDRGVSAIRIMPAFLEYCRSLKTALTRQKLREEIRNEFYKVLPKKTRRYKIIPTRSNKPLLPSSAKKIRYKSVHMADRLKDKTITSKKRWIVHARKARAYLKANRASLGQKYRTLYRRIKGGLYLKRFKELVNATRE